jgi:hypothetical protein
LINNLPRKFVRNLLGLFSGSLLAIKQNVLAPLMCLNLNDIQTTFVCFPDPDIRQGSPSLNNEMSLAVDLFQNRPGRFLQAGAAAEVMRAVPEEIALKGEKGKAGFQAAVNGE